MLHTTSKYFVFQNDLPFPNISENNDRILLQEHKQKVIFKYTLLEDSGSYKCRVSNKLGNDIAHYQLNINGE